MASETPVLNYNQQYIFRKLILSHEQSVVNSETAHLKILWMKDVCFQCFFPQNSDSSWKALGSFIIQLFEWWFLLGGTLNTWGRSQYAFFDYPKS